jgi:hypothetical protein
MTTTIMRIMDKTTENVLWEGPISERSPERTAVMNAYGPDDVTIEVDGKVVTPEEWARESFRDSLTEAAERLINQAADEMRADFRAQINRPVDAAHTVRVKTADGEDRFDTVAIPEGAGAFVTPEGLFRMAGNGEVN